MTTRTTFSLAAVGSAAIVGAMAVFVSLAAAAVTPTVTTTIKDNGNAVVTSAPLGASVHASVAVASTSATTSPAGTADFSLYSGNQICSGTPTVQAGVALSSGSAVSNAVALPAGGLSYQTHYSGQADVYTEATSSCVALAVAPVLTAGTISGTVYSDLNKNDTQDGSEPGLSGWTIWLHKAPATTSASLLKRLMGHDYYDDPIVATATTDANGNYSFASLTDDTYFVEESVQSGWRQTSDDTRVVLSGSSAAADVDFANVQKAATSTNNGGGKGSDKDDDWHDNGNHTGWSAFKGHFSGWFHFGGKGTKGN